VGIWRDGAVGWAGVGGDRGFFDFLIEYGEVRGEVGMERSELLAVIEEAKQSGQTRLNLSGRQIKELPESIGQLTKLTSLALGMNELAILPESIGQLTNLTSLGLSSNQLTILSESIGQLTNLISLDISYNRLTTLPESIGQLSKLSALDLNFNQLARLPESIGQLSNLISLYLNSNHLTILPESIGKLNNLISLYLNSNHLTILPESIGKLSSLTELYLSTNELNLLPDSIGKLTSLTTLQLDERRLSGLPPEVAMKGALAVLKYYRQRWEEETDYVYEAKLLVLGEGGAGKTSLANKLINSNYPLRLEGSPTPEKSTEGINVLHLHFPHASGNPFRINIWDFGGQEIYHATHQFFLTKRSLYILVADTRQDNTDFNYWLEVVELLSEASPTLIIKNEKQDRLCKINENQLRGQFPNLEKILPTNLADNRGLPDILTAIQHNISQLPHIGTPLPKTWVRVRNALETDTRNYITQTEFLNLCDTHGFKRHEDKLQLSSYLHDLGVCLHFQDDPVLKNIVILKPEWGTAAVYKVLDTKQVNQNFGCFTQTDLTQIWADEQYIQMRHELLQLMKNFKLCYEIPNRPNKYIVPQLLSPNQPEYTWDATDNLILRYQYEFMPKGMLTRFTVEMHRLIDSDLVWKDGVILTKDNTRAEIIEAYYKNEIRIRISGKLKKPLLESIRHEFSKIHDSYERLRYQEFIPCNCSQCKGSQTPHSYPLRKLQERLSNDRQEIECDIKPYEIVKIRSLIDDAIGPAYFAPDPKSDRYTEKDTSNTTIIINTGDSRVTDQSQKISNFNGSMSGVIGSDNNDIRNNQFTQTVNSQNLTQAAQDIKALLDQLAIEYPDESPYVQAGRAIDSIKQRAGNAIKEAGSTAVEKAIEAVTDNPAVSIVVAGIKGFIDA
jgi:internalin A